MPKRPITLQVPEGHNYALVTWPKGNPCAAHGDATGEPHDVLHALHHIATPLEASLEGAEAPSYPDSDTIPEPQGHA